MSHSWDRFKTEARFYRAVQIFTLEKQLIQRLGAHLTRCREAYGNEGPMISGGFYGNWPHAEKQRIRRLNRAINHVQGAGFAAKPARVRLSTMRDCRMYAHTRKDITP